ncbi:MAG: diacylglycerol kinase [Betaproteobacteria bacterium]|nr:diacylglycerol kinase [Betaproteobacteria bacterium]
MSNHAGRGGIGRLIDATHWSLSGLAAALRNEAAFRQELFCAAVMVPLGLWLGANGLERAMLVASVLQVLVVELLNSALEAAVDRVSLEHHELAGRAKDIGSAAVMVSLVLCVTVWLLVLRV